MISFVYIIHTSTGRPRVVVVAVVVVVVVS